MIRVLSVVVALAMAVAACSSRDEEPVLSEFFSASRLRDRTALQKLARTAFDPATDGIITSFSITGVQTIPAGGRAIEEVSISAPVKVPSGETLQKNLVVTLERGVSGGGAGPRWIVTAIRDAAAGPSPPPR